MTSEDMTKDNEVEVLRDRVRQLERQRIDLLRKADMTIELLASSGDASLEDLVELICA